MVLNLNLDIELPSFLNVILEKDESNKENLELEVGHHIITMISESVGYSWFIRIKIKNKCSYKCIPNLYYINMNS